MLVWTIKIILDVQEEDQMMPVNEMMAQEDEIEGSGNEPQIEPVQAQPGVASRVRIETILEETKFEFT